METFASIYIYMYLKGFSLIGLYIFVIHKRHALYLVFFSSKIHFQNLWHFLHPVKAPKTSYLLEDIICCGLVRKFFFGEHSF